MIYNLPMSASDAFPPAPQNVLSGIGRFPLSRRPLLQTRQLKLAERAISDIAAPLCHRLENAASTANIHLTGMQMARLKLFGISYGTAVHIHSQALADYHVLIPLQGALTVTSNTQTTTIGNGEALIYPPGTCIADNWSLNCVMLVVIVPAAELEDLHYQHQGQPLQQEVIRINLQRGQGRTFANLLACLCAECDNDLAESACSDIAKGLQDLLLLALLRLCRSKNAADSKLTGTDKRCQGLQRALNFMRKHSQKTVSLAEICKAAYLSKRSLQLAFQENIGIGPMRYYKYLRLALARKTLQETSGIAVAEVAYCYGFDNPASFSRLYKKRYAEYPSACRQTRSSSADADAPALQPLAEEAELPVQEAETSSPLN